LRAEKNQLAGQLVEITRAEADVGLTALRSQFIGPIGAEAYFRLNPYGPNKIAWGKQKFIRTRLRVCVCNSDRKMIFTSSKFRAISL
jgi:hypothetical protein